MINSVKNHLLTNSEWHTKKAHEDIRICLTAIEEQYKTLNYSGVLHSLASAHEDLGLIAYFTRKDCAAFKQHWYLASRLTVHAARHDPDSDSYTSSDTMSREIELLYAFVSDSPTAINEVMMLDTPRLRRWRDDPKAREFSVHLAQLIMRGDDEAAQAKIEIGAKKAGGNLKKAYIAGTDFYSLLMKGDKADLEASIMDYIKQEQKNTLPTLSDFIRPVSTFRAKLCWHKGVPVEIEHPMVPMAWMPIKPLPRYDDIYDFLSPDWVPPDQGFFARLSRKLKKEFPTVDACMERIWQIDECPPRV